MGASPFVCEMEATSAQEAFDYLVDEAIKEYGVDCYNGTISTCSLSRIRQIAPEYSDDVKSKALEIIDGEDNGHKWEAECLDLGRICYQIVKIKKTAVATISRGRGYMVIKYDSNGNSNPCRPFSKKTDAEAFAGEQVLEVGGIYEVAKIVPNEDICQNIVSRFSTTITESDKKPKTIPKNAVLKEIHEYMFFGWAAE